MSIVTTILKGHFVLLDSAGHSQNGTAIDPVLAQA